MNLIKIKNIISESLFFYLLLLLLLVTLIVIHTKIWFGGYSYSHLELLKQEISLLEDKNEFLKKQNELLGKEKKKFQRGRNAIEGIARSELGLIKPGEVFYQFKKQKPEKEISKKTERSID
tara:strand:- start:817 stop:1179 length:363 start_codon:yes stop_codon:yes gene_type:complete